MKLWEVMFDNGESFDLNQDWTELMIGETEDDVKFEAEVRLRLYFQDKFPYADCTVLREIAEVDGYEIKLIKKS